MKMIVGLGNPGSKYARTKHNIGFMVIDQLCEQFNVTLNKHDFEAEYGSFKYEDETILLVKPLTFMNDSGRSVGPLMKYYQINLDELVVVQDDMDLTLGKLRLRQKGSAGGHNGIKSIIASVQSSEFKRVKIGIQHPQKSTVVNWVLTPFDKDSTPMINQALDQACQAITDWCQNDDFMQTMNKFN
ncbi:aminoacyl-tRNA hydrolase [Latilactobacillus graminis]|uniref:Peptidyl-tRNA hydrolase n=2 Tax=Latilactobacillus graminis TaxID=60519 RepID=A0AA89I9Y0_9LACO|nr:aminoacyl-tRNA hydrolase [Latilactobacillus graminis]KRM24465.1 peptidyl-tRNA hydrolase [Latilactobacillus graminis DSM 20719]QFP79077.1 aminoacyl-tRNA hydrolase [Latilactobacillus graminis]